VIIQPIHDIAELCSRKGLSHAIICPGSRCAPLTLAFTRHSKINTRTFSDERSAGFVALGLAQQNQKPTILVCTSGSAAYNFAPAVAEAYFAQTPLIVFTADRPTEWIAQHDGQTIHQAAIFGSHVKKSYQLPQTYDHPDDQWAINRMVNEAINTALAEPKGPVHINVPFREPFYPSPEETLTYSAHIRVMESLPANYSLSAHQQETLKAEWATFNNILVVAGQTDYDKELINTITNFQQLHDVPIIADIIANLHPVETIIQHTDVFLGQAPDALKKTLQPDLLITFGKSVLSKNTKLFLRKYKPKAHWHIQPAGDVADPFQTISKIIFTTPRHFFQAICTLPKAQDFESQRQSNYQKLWEIEGRKALRVLQEFFPAEVFGEIELVKKVIEKLPPKCNLHLANSMSVRYGNFIGLTVKHSDVRVFSNRGTSGIDGCTSTAIGHALGDETVPTFLITGDLAFFYDRNAFWHKYTVPNLRVVVLNNHGSIIFKLIDGPAALPEADEFFITQQNLTARKLCEEFGFTYLHLSNKRKIKNTLNDFFDFDGTVKILELESDINANKDIFAALKQKIKKSYEL
jgi:2-succinyl-5-enolpyruvyl-6-hydroxy-3-cyclohexene-1-carboxylate synthase